MKDCATVFYSILNHVWYTLLKFKCVGNSLPNIVLCDRNTEDRTRMTLVAIQAKPPRKQIASRKQITSPHLETNPVNLNYIVFV